MRNICNAALMVFFADKKRKWIAAVLAAPLCLAAVLLTGTLFLRLALADSNSGSAVTATICGIKTVDGEGAIPDEEFFFTLTQWSSPSADTGAEVIAGRVTAPLTASAETSGAGDYPFQFPEITFTAPGGPYYFKIEELTPGGGWTSGSPAQIVRVYVKRDQDSGTDDQGRAYAWNDLYVLFDYPEHDPYVWEAPNKNNPFGSASYFGVFALENVTLSGADIEGCLAAGGNTTVLSSLWDYYWRQFAIGEPNRDFVAPTWPARPYTPTALVRGDLTMQESHGITTSGGKLVMSKNPNSNISATSTQGYGTLIRERPDPGTPGFTYYNPDLGNGSIWSMIQKEKLISYGDVERVERDILDVFFSRAEDDLQELSDEWRGYTSAGRILVIPPVTKSSAAELILNLSRTGYSGYDKIVYNVTLSGAALQQFSNIRLVVPEDFKGDFIINYLVGGSNVTLSANSAWATWPSIYSTYYNNTASYTEDFIATRYFSGRVFHNFPSNVSHIFLYEGTGLRGSALAPYSDITLRSSGSQLFSHSNPSGHINGLVVCKNYTSRNKGEQHNTTLFAHKRGRVSFQNTYIQLTGGAEIYARKTVTGPGAPANTGFVFTLSKSDEYGGAADWPADLDVSVTDGIWNETNKTITVSRSAAGEGDADFSIAFSGLAAAAPHYFILRETAGGGTGWGNAANEYLLRLSIPPEGGAGVADGYKERANSSVSWPSSFTTGSVAGSSAGNRAAFENAYAPAPGSAQLKATKTVGGNGAPLEWSFDFEAYASDITGETGAKLGTTKTATHINGEVAFDSISLTEAKDYYILIKEAGGEQFGWQKDPAVYLVKLVVEDVNGQLEVTSAEISKDGGSWEAYTPANITFHNSYVPGIRFPDVGGIGKGAYIVAALSLMPVLFAGALLYRRHWRGRYLPAFRGFR
ncbi:MAG: choice-of-anchor A family protein [Oscillospiraceae bacterium]|nr:choice-of-anchor A family protein [Oscillospiraceae bacterium]